MRLHRGTTAVLFRVSGFGVGLGYVTMGRRIFETVSRGAGPGLRTPSSCFLAGPL